MELPPRPPEIPLPPLAPAMLFASLLMGASVMLMLTATDSLSFFLAGVAAAMSGSTVATFLAERRRARIFHEQVTEVWELVCQRLRLTSALVERHGPDGIEIMAVAEKLFMEGDFESLQAAVAAIERHHDLEPTVLDDED
jgi:hypothetical protein